MRPRWLPAFCLPTPMNPSVSRSLGAAFPGSWPRAEAGMIVGAAMAPATAAVTAAAAPPFIRSRRETGFRELALGLRLGIGGPPVGSFEYRMTRGYVGGQYRGSWPARRLRRTGSGPVAPAD